MHVLGINKLTVTIGGRTIFANISWELDEHARVGLVGPNGAGKSTLLRAIAGLEESSGEIIRRRGLRVAYLTQHVMGDERTPIETIRAARQDLAALEAQIAACEAELGSPAIAADLELMTRVLERHARLLEQYEVVGGPSVENAIRGWLTNLELDPSAWNQPTNVLSGGQRKLVGLAACLVQQPDVLLLDEPETHLDLPHRQILERLIREFGGAVVIVAHDRYLLDETVTSIAHLEDGKLSLWQGNYSAYAVARELALYKQQQDFVTQQKEIARLEEAIARFKLWASLIPNERHIKQARVKQMQIDKMDKVDKPVLERRTMALHLRSASRGGQKIVELRHVSQAFDDVPVLLDVEDTVWRGERVGIIGANGAGKSVLGRLLAGKLAPSEGEVWRGPSISVGYFGQGSETLAGFGTPIEAVRHTKSMYEEQAVGFLGQFLFTYAQCRQPISTLSGGERARLQLALLMLERPNCLILDEPTNHLDIPAAEVLEGALERYDGTVIVVSHDRYFLDRIVDRLLIVSDGNVMGNLGGYSSYVATIK